MEAIVEKRQKSCATCGARHFCRIQDRVEDMTALCPREIWEQLEFEMSMDIDSEGR